MISKAFHPNISNLHPMLSWIRSNVSFKEMDLLQMELAIEEAFINIAQHAYPDNKKTVIISIDTFPDYIEIIFQDEGIPYNPLDNNNVPKEASLEEKKEGGLGIFLIKQIMDEVKYQRKEPYNILILRKKI